MNSGAWRSWTVLALAVAGTTALLIFGAAWPTFLPGLFSAPWLGNDFVDAKLKYQAVTLLMALAILGLAFVLLPDKAKRFYRLGAPKALVTPVKWLGIKAGETWLGTGISFSIIVSLATGIFIYLNLAQGQSLEAGHEFWLPFIILLAGMNAFTEEGITRLSVVTALDGRVSPQGICLISAALFGLPHFFGVPGGLLGSLMAAFIGWLLAKSILETKGIFWAWFIHFLQDVIIFTGLFFVAL